MYQEKYKTADDIDLCEYNGFSDNSAVMQSLSLPTTDDVSATGAGVSWVSNNVSVISNAGAYTSPSEAQNVQLQVTLQRGSYSATSRKNITVVPKTVFTYDSIELDTAIGAA